MVKKNGVNTNYRRVRQMLPSKYELIEPRFRRWLSVVDAAGSVLFWPWRAGSRAIDLDAVRSMLVVCNYGLGDAVLSTGCLRALRERFPKARIDAVAGPRSAEIVKTFPYFHHVFEVDHPLYRWREGKPPRRREFAAAMREIRAQRYDVCLDLLGDLANCWLAFRSGARHRLAHASMGGGFLLTHIVPRDGARRTQQAILAEPLALFGIEPREFPLEVFFSDSDASRAAEVLRDGGCRDRPLAVFAPGALHQAKMWPADRFGRLADLLARERGMFVCLVGAAGDRAPAEQAAAHGATPMLNLCGRLALTETVALISRARLFVGNDTGLMHVAAATGVPVVQLFGPGLPERFGHHGPHDLIFFDPRCAHHPCSPYSCRIPDQWCMKNISVEEVFAGICKKILPRE